MDFHPAAEDMCVGARALLCARIYEERRKSRAQWLREARRSFVATPQEPCAICGKYEGLTQAHHVLPLSLQESLRLNEPIHEHIWLCPTHHVALHHSISNLLKNISANTPGMPPEEADAIGRIAVRFVELYIANREGLHDCDSC